MTRRESDLMDIINAGAKVLECGADFITYKVEAFDLIEIRYYDYLTGEYEGRETLSPR